MARRLNDVSDFEPADVNSALRRQQLHSGAQAEPDQHGSLDGVGTDGEGTDWEEQSIGSNDLSEDSDDDARNIRNWVDGVEDGLDVIGMDDAHDSAIDMPGSDDEDDGGADDLDEEERERMVEYMEMFKLYRNIGRRMWKHFQHIMATFHDVHIKDGDTYGRKVRRYVDIPIRKIDRCRLGHMAFTGEYAEATECRFKAKPTNAICGELRYKPKTNVIDPNEPLVAVSQLDYIPLRERLLEQFRNAERARELQVCHTRERSADMTDWVDGHVYRKLRRQGHFTDPRELGLQLALDEIVLTGARVDNKVHKVMVVFVYLLNLDPKVRFNKSNTLLSIVIPSGYSNHSLDTFLQPLVEECVELSTVGIEGEDASDNNSKFTLKAHLILVTGDGRAVAKAMGMKEPGNTYYPCRACDIRASREGNPTSQLYIPHRNVDVLNLPLRKDLGQIIDNWEPDQNVDNMKGVTRRCVLRQVKTLYWPDSFPLDTMHCIAHNISKDVFRMLWGAKWSESGARKSEYVVSDRNKDYIIAALRDAKKTVPAYVAPPSREIGKDDITNLKTAEWKAFLLVYGPAVMQDAIPRSYWENLRDLCKLYALLLQPVIGPEDIRNIRKWSVRFVREHENLYYYNHRGRDSLPRLQVCTLQRHSLLHIAQDVQNWGPASIFAQWLPEGYLGYIKREADSPPHMIRSLIDGVLDDDRHQIILYRLNRYSPQRIAVEPGFIQEKNVSLSRTAMTDRLRSWLLHMDGIRLHQPLNARLYASYRLSSGAIVTAGRFQRKGDINRKNCYVAYYWSGAETTIMRFGEVQCFAEVQCASAWQMAWIEEWNTTKDKQLYTMTSIKDHYWIEARRIVGLVGIVTVKAHDVARNRTAVRHRIVGKDGIYDQVERGL